LAVFQAESVERLSLPSGSINIYANFTEDRASRLRHFISGTNGRIVDFCFPKGKMMQRAMADKGATLAQEIRRQANAGLMRSYAASLPLYTVSQGLPEYFSNMLEKLETAEKEAER